MRAAVAQRRAQADARLAHQDPLPAPRVVGLVVDPRDAGADLAARRAAVALHVDAGDQRRPARGGSVERPHERLGAQIVGTCERAAAWAAQHTRAARARPGLRAAAAAHDRAGLRQLDAAAGLEVTRPAAAARPQRSDERRLLVPHRDVERGFGRGGEARLRDAVRVRRGDRVELALAGQHGAARGGAEPQALDRVIRCRRGVARDDYRGPAEHAREEAFAEPRDQQQLGALEQQPPQPGTLGEEQRVGDDERGRAAGPQQPERELDEQVGAVELPARERVAERAQVPGRAVERDPPGRVEDDAVDGSGSGVASASAWINRAPGSAAAASRRSPASTSTPTSRRPRRRSRTAWSSAPAPHARSAIVTGPPGSAAISRPATQRASAGGVGTPPRAGAGLGSPVVRARIARTLRESPDADAIPPRMPARRACCDAAPGCGAAARSGRSTASAIAIPATTSAAPTRTRGGSRR